jgi:hypothetical protein
MEYIEINKSELPERFAIDLANETFVLEFYYNELGDFFTVNLYEPNGLEGETPLVMGEKLVLNQPLWGDFTSLNFPSPTIVPMDLAGKETRITWENMNETVFLYLDNEVIEDEQL